MSNTTNILKLSDADKEADLIRQNLLQYYKDIAIKIYHWENLPEGVSSDIIERILYDNGKVLFFKDDLVNYLTLPPNAFTNFNVYGIPEFYSATGYNGESFSGLNNDNSVLIKNTPTYMPTREYISILIDQLVNIYQARDVNVNAIKTPYVLSGDEKDLLSMKNMIKGISHNEVALYKNKSKASTDITLEVLNLEAPYLADKLTQLKHSIECDILTYLGLNNSDIEKAERLISDETNANNEIILNNLYLRFKERVDACEKINKMFGLNIEVKLNKEFISQYQVIDEKDTLTLNEEVESDE